MTEEMTSTDGVVGTRRRVAAAPPALRVGVTRNHRRAAGLFVASACLVLAAADAAPALGPRARDGAPAAPAAATVSGDGIPQLGPEVAAHPPPAPHGGHP